MSVLTTYYWAILFISVGLKLCLWGGYHSTDFEVHRNWLAITHQLPIREWYFEATSIWTLDYPPLFAYFEWILAKIARCVDPMIVEISSEPIATDNVIAFQRGSVIACDMLLLWSTWRYLSSFTPQLTPMNRVIIFAMIALNAGLLLIDHIHFQYNGFLMGILVITLDLCQKQQYLAAATAFSVLVFTKHLFVTLTPLFIVYFWRIHCSPPRQYVSNLLKLVRFLQLLLVALFKEAAMKQISQMISRLLPFGRGLVHTYWAPNVWALYYALDRHISTVSGILGDVEPVVLPPIGPKVCLLLTLVAMVPALMLIYAKPTALRLVRGVVYCSVTSFMLGYHVHEKAILVPMIIQALLLFSDEGSNAPKKGEAQGVPTASYIFILLSTAGTFGLFPLFNEVRELYIKTGVFLVYSLSACYIYYKQCSGRANFYFLLLLWSPFLVLHCYSELGHAYLEAYLGRKLEFLPLLLTSTTSASYLIYTWALSLLQMMQH
eukprot:GSChrysophyteH1.ASY1.ANO1.1798.1 assembled CDS